MTHKPTLIREIEQPYLKVDAPNISIGDIVKIRYRVVEGDKERLQAFAGTVIARKGSGTGETFTVYRAEGGYGVERNFFFHSPRVASIEVVRHSQVRRAKLYYLIGKVGKKAKLKEKIRKVGSKSV